MTKPIYASAEHRAIVEAYITMSLEFAEEISTKSRYYNYLDVVENIIKYHNNYGSGVKENNWHDWILIIPINLSVATSGFLAGVETRANSATVRAYRTILSEMIFDVVDKLEAMEQINE